MNSSKEKIVVITGGGAGIGLATAIQFIEQGAKVLVTGRRLQPLQALANTYSGIDFVVADAGRADDAVRTIETVIERFGRIDVLVNNAGAATALPLEQANVDAINQIFAINVLGPSLLTKAALPFLKTTHGCIVNVSSTYGHKAVANFSHYAASKAALEHLTRCWALELAPAGIRVNGVAAGPTETDFLADRMGLTAGQVDAIKAAERERIPLGRRGNPDDVARWIVAFASPSSEWITGQILSVDGGLDVT